MDILKVGISLIRQILEILIIIRVLLSWINQNHYNPLIQQVYRLTDPILKPFQELLPPEKTGGLDISPILAILTIRIIAKFLWNYL